MSVGKNEKAVAIVWESEDSIPFISAAGEGFDADAILKAAMDARVPILTNPGVLEELLQLQLSEEIPDHLYLVVAQILAFVRFMEGKLSDPQQHRMQH